MESFFGFGLPELVFILIIAMMVFGPRRLPEIAAKIGRYVQQVNRMAQPVRSEWQRQMSEVMRMQNETQNEIQKVKQALPPSPKQVTESVKNSITNAVVPRNSSTNPGAKKSSPAEVSLEKRGPEENGSSTQPAKPPQPHNEQTSPASAPQPVEKNGVEQTPHPQPVDNGPSSSPNQTHTKPNRDNG